MDPALRATLADVLFQMEPQRVASRAIPIPQWSADVLEAAVLVTLSVGGLIQAPPDTLRQAEREATRAARRYEQALVWTAPRRFGGRSPDRCDERIGRFCFWFGSPDTPRRPIEPEAPEVETARDGAIHAFRRWFALAAGEADAAGPLIRYLIESERAGEAVAAARAHVWAAETSPESLLLLGLALHYARDFVGSESAFDSARALLDPDERRRLDDVGVLLERAEQSHYNDLDDDLREQYEARFWALADPSRLEPGNERRSAHYARHGWSRVMARAPRVEGRIRWGRDHHEIVLRYGLPTGRYRILDSPSMLNRPTTLAESFDPRQVALGPGGLLTDGVGFTPPPGTRSEIARDTSRTAYAPLGVRRTQGLVLQASVFPGREEGVFRVDALLPPDTVEPRVPARPRGLLVLLDTLGQEVARAPATPGFLSDSLTVLTAEQRVPSGSYIYHVEVRDDSTGLAGLAQYRIDVPRADGLTLSDILVAVPGMAAPPTSRADPDLEATARLTLLPDQEISLYAELSGLGVDTAGASFDVEWWVERVEGDGLLRRAARWVGERIGLLEEERPTRVSWEEASRDEAQILFVTLTLTDLRPGLHRLGLRVRDRVTGDERTATRLIRIDPAAAPLPPRRRS
jgi:hypothetical protein